MKLIFISIQLSEMHRMGRVKVVIKLSRASAMLYEVRRSVRTNTRKTIYYVMHRLHIFDLY